MSEDAQLVALLEKQTELLAALARKEEVKTKAPAGFGTAVELHGEGSLFGSQSIEREVVSAHIRPTGISTSLPWIPSVFTTPFFAAITGFTASAGSEATNPCDDNPAGYMKACNLTAMFGRAARDTRTIEINDVVLRRNRGDFTDLMLYGKLLGLTNLTPGGLDESQVLNIVTQAEMVIAGIGLERLLNSWTFQGNPALRTAGGGFIPFPGLDRQIATGHVDAETNTACPALDSDIKSFAFDLVDGTGRDIVEYVTMMEAYLRFNAERMGLNPVSYIIAMRPELWYTLTNVWPCRYNTYGCTVRDNPNLIDTVPQLNSVDMTRMRDDMRNGMYLDINGRRYPVVLSDGIFEDTNITNANCLPGQFASALYFIPVTIQGGMPVTYFEYVDYRRATPDVALLHGKEQFWSDDGRYYWAIENNKWCFKLSVKTEPRIVLRTPQLAGRITQIKYRPLQHFRSSDPTSPYFADGGVSVRGDQSYRHVW